MTFQVPWLSSGISEVPLELARVLAYVATGGADGVAAPGDLKVVASSTPNSTAWVSAGAVAVMSRFPGSVSQTYIGRNNGWATTTVPANGDTGATRYHLVYVYIRDPGADGVSTVATPVQIGVTSDIGSATITKLQDVPGYTTETGYAIARIAMPVNTSTVADSQITDLRSLLNRRSEDIQRLTTITSTSSNTLTSTTDTTWPAASQFNDIYIPTWASTAMVVAHVSGFKILEGGSTGAALDGQLHIDFNGVNGPDTIYDYTVPTGRGTADAGTIMTAASFNVTALRGTTRTVKLEANRLYANPTTASLDATKGTTIVFTIKFVESSS